MYSPNFYDIAVYETECKFSKKNIQLLQTKKIFSNMPPPNEITAIIEHNKRRAPRHKKNAVPLLKYKH